MSEVLWFLLEAFGEVLLQLFFPHFLWILVPAIASLGIWSANCFGVRTEWLRDLMLYAPFCLSGVLALLYYGYWSNQTQNN